MILKSVSMTLACGTTLSRWQSVPLAIPFGTLSFSVYINGTSVVSLRKMSTCFPWPPLVLTSILVHSDHKVCLVHGSNCWLLNAQVTSSERTINVCDGGDLFGSVECVFLCVRRILHCWLPINFDFDRLHMSDHREDRCPMREVVLTIEVRKEVTFDVCLKKEVS